MTIELTAFAIIVSVILALLEIQIEGGNGWAEKLPTWRIKNPVNKILNWPDLTGYHFYLNLLFVFILQLPFFLGFPFSLKNELLILELFLLIMLTEDFLWFVLNPKWGVKRFFRVDVPWQAKRFLWFPQNYWVGVVTLILLEILRSNI